MLFIGAVDLVAPCPRLTVQVVPISKGSPGQKVSLDKMKRTFDATGAVGIADFVRYKAESQPIGKRRHFGNGNHPAAGPAQYNNMSVVDHHPLGGASEVSVRVRKKHFAVESLEAGKELKEEHARVAQDCRGCLNIARFAAHHDAVGRCVMLYLFPGHEVVLSRRLLFRLPDVVTAAEGCQRLIGQFRSFCNQFLMDSDQVAVAGGIQFQDSLPVRLRTFRTLDERHFGCVRSDDSPNRRPGESQCFGNLPYLHPLVV